MSRILIQAASISFLALVISACNEPPPTYSDGGELAADEGILVLVHHCNDDKVNYFLHGSNGSLTTPNFGRGTEVHLLRVPAGTYEVQSMKVNNYPLTFQDVYTFEVTAGELTYPGDFVLNGLQLGWNDNQEALEGYLAENYPRMYEEFDMHFSGDVVENRKWRGGEFRRAGDRKYQPGSDN